MNCPKCSAELKLSTRFCIHCGARTSGSEPNEPIASPDPLMGRLLLEQFLIQKRLGEGGFGAVYLAEQPRLRRQVAIKALHPHLGKNPEITRRFEIEGMAASQIDHPLALKMYASGETEDGYLWLAMEFLEGETLADRLKREKAIPVQEFVALFKSACEVLEAAHEVGIKHRDLKPENLMLVQSKQGLVVKILDFGIAGIVSAASKTTSDVSGSPPFMAPEQFKGLKFADHRSDIYSLGVIAYVSLTGVLPVVGDDFWSWAFKHSEEKIKDPREVAPNKDIPEATALAILKAMAKKPNERFQSPMSFWRALSAAFTDAPSEASSEAPKEPTKEASKEPLRPLVALPFVAEKKPKGPLLKLLYAVFLVGFVVQYQEHGKIPPLPQEPTPSQAPPQSILSQPAPLPSQPVSISEQVLLTIKSIPSGAKVLQGNDLICASTPCELRQEKNQTLQLTLELAGYEPKRVSIQVDKEKSHEAKLETLRFVDNHDGTVTDRKSNPPLMWSKYDNGRGAWVTEAEAKAKPHTLALDWNDANAFCKNLRDGGYEDWRLPSLTEASALYQTGSYTSMKEVRWTVQVTNLLVLSGCCTWTSDNKQGEQAAIFTFADGNSLWGSANGLNATTRTLCVRSLEE